MIEKKKYWLFGNGQKGHNRPHTIEGKKRISEARKGKGLHSKEWKDKMSKRMKGHKFNLGSKHTIEHKRKISETMRKRVKLGIHNFWKGGISRTYKTGYYSSEYKYWRLRIFERDNYTCQVCRKVGGYLTAHHIKSFTHYPKLRFKLTNGITLCEDCHKLTDNYKGRANRKEI